MFYFQLFIYPILLGYCCYHVFLITFLNINVSIPFAFTNVCFSFDFAVIQVPISDDSFGLDLTWDSSGFDDSIEAKRGRFDCQSIPEEPVRHAGRMSDPGQEVDPDDSTAKIEVSSRTPSMLDLPSLQNFPDHRR
ncbi:hypothetical protein L1887_28988 [Cichorium endivia]|nr:hypothetical protein L1887_28988 [Cichorium endivia]